MIKDYKIHQVSEYINWIYFFHARGFAPKFSSVVYVHNCESCLASWFSSFPEDERNKAREAANLLKDAKSMICVLDQKFHTHAICKLFCANSKDDDIIIEDVVFPMLRQQTNHSNEKETYLCLSDYIRPASTNIKDKIGVFATTVDRQMEHFFDNDDYKKMLCQTLCDRLAEATAEKMHEYVRKEMWGYADKEKLSPKELFEEKYQGIRPAVGYPSLPDQSVNFIIDQLIDFSKIGITLTENGMMIPHASVSGLMFSHPKAEYFSVGTIDEEQLADYANRRGITIEKAKKFLTANL